YSRVQFSPDLVPVLDAYGQTEFILPVAVGYRVPGTAIDEFQTGGLSVGGTIRYIRRQVTAKQSPIDALDDTESLYFFRGSGLGLDIGAHYEEVLPNVNAGLAIFNLIGGGVDLNFEGGRIPFDDSDSTGPFEILFGVSEPTNASPLSAADSLEFQELQARFAERSAAPIVRLGAAYDIDFDRQDELGLPIGVEHGHEVRGKLHARVALDVRADAHVDRACAEERLRQ
ncbi:MAG: hypothetical protein AAFV01_08775, partial [Bacteroidota bacterium]